MRFMILLTGNALTEAGAPPNPELLAAMGAYNEALVEAGVMHGGGGFTPTARGARVGFAGSARSVTRGPFSDRTVTGYWIFETGSLEEAIEWVKRCPNPTGETGEIEIRQLYDPEDFAESDPTGELRRKEVELAARIQRDA
jgi:hypothetical protein